MHLYILNKVLVVFACVAHFVNSELFTAVVELQKALYAEKEVASDLRNHIRAEEERLEKLRTIAGDFERHANLALGNTEFYLANPVNAFLLVKRFTLDWGKLDSLLSHDHNTKVLAKINSYRQNFPDSEDLNGVAAALLRLQDTYQLDTRKIASGDLAGLVSTQLTAGDCFHLGKLSYEGSDFYHTILWMEESLSRVEKEQNKTAEKPEILDYLSYSMYQQGNMRHALALTRELLELVPDHVRAQNNRDFYESSLQKELGDKMLDDQIPAVQNIRSMDPYRSTEEFLTYEALCRNEKTQKYKYQDKLKCRYRHNNDPVLLLNPIKEEEVYLNPWIVVFHDMMNDKEIETIKRYATPRLSRATSGIQNHASDRRIAKSAWLKGFENPMFERINRRIGAIAEINQETAEDLQVVNYGIGGHYEPHFDFARRDEKHAFPPEQANRIATLLFYMSDVAAGGATVFPYIGVKLFPKKGAAAFWYNLYRNGEGIYDTRHAACPVLAGSKWVCNKWMHERGQEFRRPCTLRPDE